MIVRTVGNGFQHPTTSDITPQQACLGRRPWMPQAAIGTGGIAFAA